MNTFLESLKNFGVMRLAIMGSVLAALAGFFIMVTNRMNEPDMALLYADIDPGDGGQVISRLESMNIPVEVRGGGTQIFIPSEQIARTRMVMAEAGLPSGGALGYEIFDKTDVLGSTSFVQDINRLRALEGELSRSIKSINNVASARVHLVMPKRDLFSKDTQPPSASIVLRMRGGRLTASQVQGVQHLVAAAVAGLSPGQISIIDERGTLLARGNDGDDGAMIQGLEEAQLALEDRMARTIETLLERSLGAGKVRAEVRAEINRNRTVENEEIFDPDGQVVRSSQTTEDNGNSKESKSGAATSVTSNIPNAGGAGGASGQNSSENKRTEETINYEVSKTIRTNTKEAGDIKKMSVAVLVDGTYTKGTDGKETYAPRPAPELEQIKKLVQSAVGFDTKRGDTLEVINMQFAAPPKLDEVVETDLFMGFAKHDVMRFAETIVLSIIALLALLLGIKPIITRLLAMANGPAQNMTGEEAERLALVGGGGGGAPLSIGSGIPQQQQQIGQQRATPGLPGPSSSGSDAAQEVMLGQQKFDEMLELNNVVGQMKASSVKKIEGLIDKNTQESVGRVRSWLNEKAA